MQLVVKENQKKERIDKYLADNTTYSRALICKMINDGFVIVNAKKAKPSYIIKTNDQIAINESYLPDSDLVPKEIPLDIIYEDDDIMIINKQSGLTVHPGNGNCTNTLVNALLFYEKSLSDKDSIRPGIVHRIDKDTSGLMIVAKTNRAHEILADDFKNKRVKREYIALLDGVFPHNEATIDAPIGKDNANKSMVIKAVNSKKAITHLKVIKRFQQHTLVTLCLETGRTHQIRVHMKYIGYPIHNDPIYNNKSATAFGQFLHSWRISFIHPVTKKEMFFETPIPNEFNTFINNL